MKGPTSDQMGRHVAPDGLRNAEEVEGVGVERHVGRTGGGQVHVGQRAGRAGARRRRDAGRGGGAGQVERVAPVVATGPR